MGSPNPAGRAVLDDLLTRYPEAATKTIARKAYAAHPECWTSLESCRSMVRQMRGNRGAMLRKKSTRTHFRPNGKAGEPTQFKLPDALECFDDWQIQQVDTPGWWLVLSDVHVPYHQPQAIEAAVALAKERGIVGVLLNGDIADCYAISRWETDPRKRRFAAELTATADFLGYIRSAFRKARILWKYGNHEERYEAYMRIKAPELLDVPAFDYSELTKCHQYDIEVVRDKQPISLGKLIVIHGHEYRSPFQNPVNPARGLFLRARVSSLCGHLHQSSSHSEKDARDHVTTCWSTGCLCSLRPEYMPLNKWNHGAALVQVSRDGSYEVENFRVLDGKVYR